MINLPEFEMAIPSSCAEYIATPRSNENESWGREIARINFEVADQIAGHFHIGDGDWRRDIISQIWELGRKIVESKCDDLIVISTDFAGTADEVTIAEFVPDNYRSRLAFAASENFGVV